MGVGVGVTVGLGVVGVGVGVPVVAPVHVVPFTANEVGTGLEPLHEPLNPKLAVPPVPRDPL